MITLDTLKKRNHDFAAHRFTSSMSLFPTSKPIIISCVDPRTIRLICWVSSLGMLS